MCSCAHLATWQPGNQTLASLNFSEQGLAHPTEGWPRSLAGSAEVLGSAVMQLASGHLLSRKRGASMQLAEAR